MPLVESLSYGWLIILIGAGFLVLEVFSPGFFLAVPGTVLIILGMLSLLGVDIFSSGFGIIFGIVITIAASLITVWVYGRLTPGDEKPLATSMDSVVGKRGIVKKTIDSETLSGKVLIEGLEWSAKTETGEIPKGSEVEVISSSGVHIIVKEVE